MVFFQKKTANYLENGKEVVYEKSTIYASKNYFYVVENIRTVILKKVNFEFLLKWKSNFKSS